MANRAVKVGFDQEYYGTLRVKGGKFVAEGPRAEAVLELAKQAAEGVEFDNPDADPETLTHQMVMERMVKTMQGRCHAVWEDEAIDTSGTGTDNS